MVDKSKGNNNTATNSKKIGSELRVYKDLKCPYCGSHVYWGTHKCRRCGKNFPDELINEVDHRSMMHYIPIEYDTLRRENNVTTIMISTIIIVLLLIGISAFTKDAIYSDINIYYIISWTFFVTIIISTLLTILFLAEPKNKIMTKDTILFTLVIMGIIGLCTGFTGLIQLAVLKATETELIVCTTYVILSAIAIAGGRSSWPKINIFQILSIIFSCIFISAPLLWIIIRPGWSSELINAAGNPFATALVFIIGFIALISASYTIFHGTKFPIRLNVCYPTWFAGMTFMTVFFFSKAALFRWELQLNYAEALIFLTGLILIMLGFFLFIRKIFVDNYIQAHLTLSKHQLALAESQFRSGSAGESLKKYEQLLQQNPALAFGTTNSHPALEMLGIDFSPKVKISSEEQSRRVREEESESGKEEGVDKTYDASMTGDRDSSEEEKEGEAALDFTEEEDEEERELIQAEALALLKKSIFYEKAGQRRKALSCLERSIKLNRSNPETWIRLGHLMSKLGSSWNKIKSYYNWVIDIKLKTIQQWVESENVPPKYALWILDELSVLKSNMLGIGKVLRTMKTADSKKIDLARAEKKKR